MSSSPASALRAALWASVSILLTGCSYSIRQPRDNPATLETPAKIVVGWNANTRQFQAQVNGVDSTSRFTIGDSAVAILALAPGQQHTIRAGGEIYCWYCGGYISNFQTRTITATRPRLTFPAGNQTLAAGTQRDVTVVRSNPNLGLAVSVGAGNGNVTLGNAAFQLAQDDTEDAVRVTAVTAGQATLTATAPGYQDGTATITVTPALAAVAPMSAAAGQTITLTGAGFAAGAQARFNATPAATTFVSGTGLTAVVPPNLSGGVTLTAVVNGQTSNGLAFTVAAGQPGGVADLVVRASDDDVQLFDFGPQAPVLRSTRAASPAPGGLAGTAANAAAANGAIFRAGSSDLQMFTITNNAFNAPVSINATPAQAIAVAASGNVVVRAHPSGIQVFERVNNALQARGALSLPAAAGGVGVAIRGATVVRTTGTTLESISIANLNAPALIGSAPQVSSSGTGVAAVAFVDANRIVRAFDSGAEIFDVPAAAAPSRVGQPLFNLTPSSASVGLAPFGNTRVVRATTAGIEVLTIANNALALTTTRNGGDLSASGVAVVVSGNFAYRATDDAIERYDLTNLQNVPAPRVATSGQHQVSLSSTGVGIAKP